MEPSLRGPLVWNNGCVASHGACLVHVQFFSRDIENFDFDITCDGSDPEILKFYFPTIFF